jgi:hypothetical protein
LVSALACGFCNKGKIDALAFFGGREWLVNVLALGSMPDFGALHFQYTTKVDTR